MKPFYKRKRFWISILAVILIYVLFIVLTGKFLGNTSKLGNFGSVKQVPQSVIIKSDTEKLRRIQTPDPNEVKIDPSLDPGPGVFKPELLPNETPFISCNDGSQVASTQIDPCKSNGGIKK
jgi:hypothetical protein